MNKIDQPQPRETAETQSGSEGFGGMTKDQFIEFLDRSLGREINMIMKTLNIPETVFDDPQIQKIAIQKFISEVESGNLVEARSLKRTLKIPDEILQGSALRSTLIDQITMRLFDLQGAGLHSFQLGYSSLEYFGISPSEIPRTAENIHQAKEKIIDLYVDLYHGTQIRQIIKFIQEVFGFTDQECRELQIESNRRFDAKHHALCEQIRGS